MALMSWGHSQYWAATGGGGPVTGFSGKVMPAQYIAGAAYLYSFPAQLQWFWARVVRRWQWCVWACRLLWNLWGVPPEHFPAFIRVARITSTPVYSIACRAVRTTATLPGMRDPHRWKDIDRMAKAWGWSENTHRRHDANERAQQYCWDHRIPVSNQERELAVELAYQAYVEVGR